MTQISGITIAIPTYNRAELLRDTLCSINKLFPLANVQVEVVVIDNNSSDNTRQIVDEFLSRSVFPVRYTCERRQGLCFCRNAALEMAHFNEVVYFDDDVSVAPYWLQGYCEAIAKFDADCETVRRRLVVWRFVLYFRAVENVKSGIGRTVKRERPVLYRWYLFREVEIE